MAVLLFPPGYQTLLHLIRCLTCVSSGIGARNGSRGGVWDSFRANLWFFGSAFERQRVLPLHELGIKYSSRLTYNHIPGKSPVPWQDVTNQSLGLKPSWNAEWKISGGRGVLT